MGEKTNSKETGGMVKINRIRQKLKKAAALGLMLKTLSGMPTLAEEKNPADNKFFMIDYINGVELRLNHELDYCFKVGKIFELKKLGKIYFQGLSPNELTLNYFNKNYSLEAIIDKKTILNLEIRVNNFTAGIKSNKSISLMYLNTDGIRIIKGMNFYPLLKLELKENYKSIIAGANFIIKEKIVPYLIIAKAKTTEYNPGIEYHTKKNMIALRANISRDKKEARLDIGYKF